MLRQELNLSSLYYLFDFIELEMSHTIHPEKYYRQVEPHFKNRMEIIRLARENKPLDEMDGAEISMVLLDQLPLVIEKNTKNKCLITKDLLGQSLMDLNEQLVWRTLLKHESDEIGRLWERLVKHWSFLSSLSNVEASTLAKLFAPKLLPINSTSSEQQKCIKLLEKIINNNNNNNNNDSSLNPTETSINQELLVASNSKLKESSVYQDFIMGNKSKQQMKALNRKSEYESDDDEIDALVAPKSSTVNTTTSNKVQK